MKRAGPFALCALALLAACSRGDGNAAGNDANMAAAEDGALNMAIGGDELSPIPEAEDDMIANNSAAANGSGEPAPAGPGIPSTPPPPPPRR